MTVTRHSATPESECHSSVDVVVGSGESASASTRPGVRQRPTDSGLGPVDSARTSTRRRDPELSGASPESTMDDGDSQRFLDASCPHVV